MNALPHVQEIFDRLRSGSHLSPEDEPAFSAVAANPEAYAEYFEPLGLKLVRHPREFFYFAPESAESVPDTLPRIAVFSFILIDHADNTGKPIEDFLLNQHFFYLPASTPVARPLRGIASASGDRGCRWAAESP